MSKLLGSNHVQKTKPLHTALRPRHSTRELAGSCEDTNHNSYPSVPWEMRIPERRYSSFKEGKKGVTMDIQGWIWPKYMHVWKHYIASQFYKVNSNNKMFYFKMRPILIFCFVFILNMVLKRFFQIHKWMNVFPSILNKNVVHQRLLL